MKEEKVEKERLEELREKITVYFEGGDKGLSRIIKIKEIIFELCLLALENEIRKGNTDTIKDIAFLFAEVLKKFGGYSFVCEEREKRLNTCLKALTKDPTNFPLCCAAISICEGTVNNIFPFKILLYLAGHKNAGIAVRAEEAAENYLYLDLLSKTPKFLLILAKWAASAWQTEDKDKEGRIHGAKIATRILRNYFSTLEDKL
jgi:hypothetical protein